MRAAELVAGAPDELPTEELVTLPRAATTRTSTSGSARRIRITSGSREAAEAARGSGGPSST